MTFQLVVSIGRNPVVDEMADPLGGAGRCVVPPVPASAETPGELRAPGIQPEGVDRVVCPALGITDWQASGWSVANSAGDRCTFVQHWSVENLAMFVTGERVHSEGWLWNMVEVVRKYCQVLNIH
jgi:hypothetical protein